MKHELVKLAALIDWGGLAKDLAGFYCADNGRPGGSIRLMAGLCFLKDLKGLSDEEVCAAWRENAYFQYFCGEEFFQHRLPKEPPSLSIFRKHTDTITSCCGKLFAPEKPGLSAELAALGERPALVLLFGGLAALLAAGTASLRWPRFVALYGAGSGAFFVIAIAAVISVLSLYVYEHPNHHCPFCLLKREYHYFGFALYAPLFAGTALGLSAGFLGLLRQPAKSPPDHARTAPAPDAHLDGVLLRIRRHGSMGDTHSRLILFP